MVDRRMTAVSANIQRISAARDLDVRVADGCHKWMRSFTAALLLVLLGGILLSAAPFFGARALFDDMPLESWRRVGGAATFTLEPPAKGATGPTLVGKGPIERNGFLVSPRELGDFRLAVDVRIGSSEDLNGEKMNSGIQVRSRDIGGAIGGLQIEIDPSQRRWSGGIYDERGRGWLSSLRENDAGRAAFQLGAWNRYEVECIGPRIRTRINGVSCAEWYDGVVAGLLAFQVHGGPACEVAFRSPMLEELGRHAWQSVPNDVTATDEGCVWSSTIPANARGFRVRVAGPAQLAILAGDGACLAEITVPPLAVADAARPRSCEALWVDLEGAVLLDGALERRWNWKSQPMRVRVLGKSCVAEGAEVLQPTARTVPSDPR